MITYLFESSFQTRWAYLRQKKFSVCSSILGPLSSRILEKHLQQRGALWESRRLKWSLYLTWQVLLNLRGSIAHLPRLSLRKENKGILDHLSGDLLYRNVETFKKGKIEMIRTTLAPQPYLCPKMKQVDEQNLCLMLL